MIQKLVYRYSIAFKQQVIEQFESGRFSSINEAKEHYGIRGDCTIQKWLRKYGRNHLCPKIVRVEMPDEKDQISDYIRQCFDCNFPAPRKFRPWQTRPNKEVSQIQDLHYALLTPKGLPPAQMPQEPLCHYPAILISAPSY